MVISNKNFKFGFSLIEALVVMSIVTIFVAVIANVIPHKSKPKVSAEAHGGYECYWKNNKLYSRTITVGSEHAEKEETTSDDRGKYCVFRPNHYVPYLIFNVVGGGAKGGTNDGGAAGQFASAFFPIPHTSYKLYPGKGGTVSNPQGSPSYVTANDDVLVEVAGASDSADATTSTVDNIVDVYLAGQMGANVIAYGCNYTPRVWLGVDNLIHISFCKNSTDVVEETFEFNNPSYTDTKLRYKRTIMNSPVVGSNVTDSDGTKARVLSKLKDGTTNIWEYYDIGAFIDLDLDPLDLPYPCTYNIIRSMNSPMCPSRYKIEIKLDIPDNSAVGATSSLTKYADLMQYNNLKSIKPGNGGAQGNGAGYAGGILVSW